jgi:hypothetical protein
MPQARSRIPILVVILVVSGTACGDDADRTPAAGAGAGGTGGRAGSAGSLSGVGGESGSAPEPGELALYGTFNLTLVPPFEETMSPAMTTFFGSVADGPRPRPSAWSERNAADGCKLLVPTPLLCQPACGSAAACVGENTCARYPKNVDVGAVTLTGVGPSPISMELVAGNYQPKAGVSVPYPPCAEGEPITLAADGDGRGALELAASCIAPLEFAAPLAYEAGKPLALRWNAPRVGSRSQIHVKIDLSHHGGTKGAIECSVPDQGSLEIPSVLLDALVELGVAGFPTVALTRESIAQGAGYAANVLLTIVSSQERPLEIPGLRSCSENTDCDAGQTCQADRTCG